MGAGEHGLGDPPGVLELSPITSLGRHGHVHGFHRVVLGFKQPEELEDENQGGPFFRNGGVGSIVVGRGFVGC